MSWQEKIQRIMHKYGISSMIRRRKAYTYHMNTVYQYQNFLNRQFRQQNPNTFGVFYITGQDPSGNLTSFLTQTRNTATVLHESPADSLRRSRYTIFTHLETINIDTINSGCYNKLKNICEGFYVKVSQPYRSGRP